MSVKHDVEHLGRHGLQTVGYAWNADIRVCVRGWPMSGSMDCMRGKTEVSSAVFNTLR